MEKDWERGGGRAGVRRGEVSERGVCPRQQLPRCMCVRQRKRGHVREVEKQGLEREVGETEGLCPKVHVHMNTRLAECMHAQALEHGHLWYGTWVSGCVEKRMWDHAQLRIWDLCSSAEVG